MIEDFFIWCSGARKQVLEECPTDKVKFIGMGMAVFFVSLLSVVSATFFITYAFAKKDLDKLEFGVEPSYIMAGLLWGIIIFTMDRNIIVSIRKTGKFREEIKKGYPRLILSVFIGVVISTPLEMKFFEKEITQKVEDDIQKVVIKGKERQIAPMQYQLQEIERKVVQNEGLRDSAYAKAKNETDGTGLTRIRSYGPKAKEWETKSLQYGKIADSLNQVYLALSNKITEAKNGVSIDDLYTKGIIQKFDGAEARINALYSLGYFHWVITFLFITLEILPLLVKLMNPRGPYDEVLDRIEYEVFIKQKHIISDKNSEINRLLKELSELNTLKKDMRIKIEKSKLDAELTANEQLMRDIAEKQASLAKTAVRKWYLQEQAKLKEDNSYSYTKTKNPIPIGFPIAPPISNRTEALEDKLWYATTPIGTDYMLFKNGKLQNNELIVFEDGKFIKGNWSYMSDQDNISIVLGDRHYSYSIEEITDNEVKFTGLDGQRLHLIPA